MDLYLLIISTHHANMTVDVEDTLVGAVFIQFRQHQLLYTEHDSIFAADPNSCAAGTRRRREKAINVLHIYLIETENRKDSTSNSTYLLFSTAFMAYST